VNAGALTQVGSPALVQDGVSTLAVDPSGKFLYAPNPSTNTVTAFAIQSDGSLALLPSSPFAALTTPVAAAVNAAGDVLYVANNGSSNISQFKIDSAGALTAFTTPSQPAGSQPVFITMDPDGSFVYAGNTSSKSITEFKLNSDGSLAVTGNTIPVGVPPRSLAVTK